MQNLRSWQNQIGYVPQNVYLSDDTIKNNIAFGIKGNEISNNRLMKAIELAKLHKFIEKLPDGIDTFIGEDGSRISGGSIS